MSTHDAIKAGLEADPSSFATTGKLEIDYNEMLLGARWIRIWRMRLGIYSAWPKWLMITNAALGWQVSVGRLFVSWTYRQAKGTP